MLSARIELSAVITQQKNEYSDQKQGGATTLHCPLREKPYR